MGVGTVSGMNVRRVATIALALPLLAVPAGAAAQSAQAPDLHTWRVTSEGFGRLKVGLDRTKIERRTGRTVTTGYDTGSCASWGLRGVRGLGIMAIDGRLARIDVYKGSWQTSAGIGLGDTEADVRAAYPRIRAQQHKYDPDGKYLIVPGKHRRVVFETDGDGAVTAIRSGRLPEVMFVEGCA
jgi:hypothetical protein